MTPQKVLIIEDEKVLLDILRTKLVHDGYIVSTADNGETGLQLARSVRPDLILLDIMMPRLNGYEVLEELNKDARTLPPIIIISNSGQAVEISRAKRLGACDYIIKAELTPEEVINKVRKHLDGGMPVPNAPQKPAARTTSSKIKVLVIEDDQFLRDLLSTKLERENFDVATAMDGPEALEKIQEVKADIVLLDIILPGIDGFEILKRMKSSPSHKSIPVVLLSNLGQEADVERGKALGANDYLIKSNFTIDEIIEKIHKIVG